MKFTLTVIAILALALVRACSTLSLPAPSVNGAATLVQQGKAFYAFFPATADPGISCGYQSKRGRFTPAPDHVLAHEPAFVEAYRHWLLDHAEQLHPDSTGTIAEFPGEHVVLRKVPKSTYVRLQRQRFKRTIKWDRQYVGLVTARGDSVLAINLVQPDKWSRNGLAEQWLMGLDASADDFVALNYNIQSGSMGYLCDDLE